MKRRASPVRTCVGCRERAAKSDLLRVVVVEGSLAPDPRGRLPGRGAHVHPVRACLDLAERRRAFIRALRLRMAADPAPVRGYVERLAGEQQQGTDDEGSPTQGSHDGDERSMSTPR